MTLQPAAVMPVDVELWLTDYLRGFLAGRSEPYAAGVYVSNTKPAANRSRIITVRRDGGPVRGVFDYPRVAVRVWADVERDGADLSRLVVGALKMAPGNGPCKATTSVFGPSPVPEAGQFQWLINVEFVLACAVL